MHYGNLIDQKKYDRLDDANQMLYKYTADGFSMPYGKYFDQLTKEYPFSGGKLYRGLHFESKELYLTFLETVKDGFIEMDYPSSWSLSVDTAESFSLTKQSYFVDLSLMNADRERSDRGDYMTGYGGIVLELDAPSGNAIDVSKSAYAKESEVILGSGRYPVKIYKQNLSYQAQSENDNNFANNMAKNLDIKNPDAKALSYLDKNITKLSQNNIDKVILAQYRYGMSHTVNELSTVAIEDNTMDNKKILRIDAFYYDPIDISKGSDKLKTTLEKMNSAIANDLAKKLANTDYRMVNAVQVNQLDKMPKTPMLQRELLKVKKHFAELYHQLNSRESNRSIMNRDDMRIRTDQMRDILMAMQSL